MKKVSKRILSVVAIIILLLSICITAYASEIQPRIDFVATMKIVSFTGGGAFSAVGYDGHSFLIFTNTCNSNITVGHMPLAPGESVTVGTFGNRSAHVGIWYNIEGCYSTSTTTYALTTGLTVAELQRVNQTINDNDSWSVTNNCSSFAVKVWNSGPSGYAVSGWNPTALVSSIKNNSNHTTSQHSPKRFKRHSETYVNFLCL